MPTLLILLLALPLATAGLVALIGVLGGRAETDTESPGEDEEPADRYGSVRWLSLACTLLCVALAGAVALEYANSETVQSRLEPGAAVPGEFRPVFVPGATEANPHATTWDLFTLGSWGSKKPTAIQFFIGIDGLNVWLVLLACVLMVPSVLVSWRSINERVPEFFAWLLVLQTGLVGVFLSFDLILFYVFFELTLVPLFFLIGIWGGSLREYAAHKFFVYTLAGSLITLLGVLGIAISLAQGGPERKLTFSIPELVKQSSAHSQELARAVQTERRNVARAEAGGGDSSQARQALEREVLAWARWQRVQFWVFLALLAGFAIKVPLVPVHTWLPLAHTEAPTAGSVLLAGVLLKIGSYGLLRLCLSLVPDACLSVGTPLLGVLAVIGIIYGAFCALGQHDIKKLVAYSSVSHMGFCILGLFSLNLVGLTGGLLQMINHGLSTGALFLLVGMIYERYHTREMGKYGGMGQKLGVLACFFVFITMSSIGLPGLNGFVGEMMVLMGMYAFQGGTADGRLLAALSTFGVLLGAWYMLTLVMKVFFGPLHEPEVDGHEPGHEARPIRDLNFREWCTLVPIAVLCLALGVYPKPAIDTAKPDLQVVEAIAAAAQKRAKDLAPPKPKAELGRVKE